MQSENVAIEADEDGNFSSPILERLFEVWDQYDAEDIEEDVVLEVLKKVEERTSEQIKDMERSGEQPDVDLHDPNRVAILTSFQAHLDAAEMMRTFFKTDDYEVVDQAFEVLQDATNQMMNALHGLLVHDQTSAPKLCIRCSAPNPREARACEKCNANLPVAETPQLSRLLATEGPDTDSEDGAETTPNYMAMSDAHDGWSSEQISAEDFYNTTLTVKDRLVAEQQEVIELKSAEVQSPEVLEYLDDHAQVLEQNIASLDQLLGSLEDGDIEKVDDSMFAFAQATIALLEVEKRKVASEQE